MSLVFLALAIPRRWYNDDAFITFRYANHLAHGHGVVWNTAGGEPLEGSTSLGWTIVNAAAIVLHQHPTTASHAVGLLSGLIGLVLAYWGARRGLELDVGWALLAPAILFAGRQYLLWSVSGLETMTAAVIAFAALLCLAAEARRSELPRPWSGALFFLGTVFRPETPLLHLMAGVGLVLADRRRATFLSILRSGAIHLLLLGGLTVFRLLYFGQPLPNTFYTKVGGIQAAQGLRYLAQFLLQTQFGLWLVPVVVALVLRPRKGALVRPPLVSAALCQVIAVTIWIVLQGGDAWEFRFFVPLLLPIALLIAFAAERLLGTLRPSWVPLAIATLLALSQSLTTFTRFREFFPVVSAETLKKSADDLIKDATLLRPYLTPDDRIAFGWAGVLPYLTDAWHFDVWGLNDREIARRPFDLKGVLYHQRHAEWDDIVKREVMVADLFNTFLFDRPYPPAAIPKPLMPWAKPGVLVYCTEIPTKERYRFWIFASPRPRAEVEAWLAAKRLPLTYVAPMPSRGR